MHISVTCHGSNGTPDCAPCVCVVPSQEGTAGRAKGIQKEKGTEESTEDEGAGTRERGPEIQMAAVQQ